MTLRYKIFIFIRIKNSDFFCRLKEKSTTIVIIYLYIYLFILKINECPQLVILPTMRLFHKLLYPDYIFSLSPKSFTEIKVLLNHSKYAVFTLNREKNPSPSTKKKRGILPMEQNCIWQRVIWYQVFLSHTNNLYMIVWFQVFLYNINNLYMIV